jgi:hypothetical protein
MEVRAARKPTVKEEVGQVLKEVLQVESVPPAASVFGVGM